MVVCICILSNPTLSGILFIYTTLVSRWFVFFLLLKYCTKWCNGSLGCFDSLGVFELSVERFWQIRDWIIQIGEELSLQDWGRFRTRVKDTSVSLFHFTHPTVAAPWGCLAHTCTTSYVCMRGWLCLRARARVCLASTSFFRNADRRQLAKDNEYREYG